MSDVTSLDFICLISGQGCPQVFPHGAPGPLEWAIHKQYRAWCLEALGKRVFLLTSEMLSFSDSGVQVYKEFGKPQFEGLVPTRLPSIQTEGDCFVSMKAYKLKSSKGIDAQGRIQEGSMSSGCVPSLA